MASQQTQQKIFRIERTCGLAAAPAPANGIGGPSLEELLSLVRSIDAKVSALPRLDEIRERLVDEVVDMQGRIQDTKQEIAALRHPKMEDDGILRASMQLDAIVEQTEHATSTILEAAETLEEQISHIRGTHADDQVVANATDVMIDAVTRIYEASNFQDITGQRTRKVVDVLKYIEARLERMVNLWRHEIETLPVPPVAFDREDEGLALTGPRLENPVAGDDAISQDDIDALFR
jgi:chemotaxis protein CheZ